EGFVNSAATLPGGRALFVINDNGGHGDWELQRWDPLAGPPETLLRRAPNDTRRHVSFSPDGSTLALHHAREVVEGRDNSPTMELWDVGEKKRRHLLKWSQPVTAVGLPHFTLDGRTMAVAVASQTTGQQPAVELWDVAVGKRLHTLRGAGLPSLK